MNESARGTACDTAGASAAIFKYGLSGMARTIQSSRRKCRLYHLKRVPQINTAQLQAGGLLKENTVARVSSRSGSQARLQV